MDRRELTPEIIREILDARHLTARGLARSLGVNAATPTRWLLPRDHPQSRRPSPAIAASIWALYDAVQAERDGELALIDQLLGGTTPPRTGSAIGAGYHAGAYLTLRGVLLEVARYARREMQRISATLANVGEDARNQE